MDRNWLIRTKSNHILGPVSKEKVVELFKNKTIKGDDEICSGNGYWFFIREEELINRFLLGNEPQGFNPISEAKDVLTSVTGSSSREITKDDITVVGGINLASLKDEVIPEIPVKTAPALVTVSELPKKKIEIERLEVKSSNNDQKVPKKSEVTQDLKKNQQVKVKKNQPSKQGYLKYVGIIGFIILFLAIYYRKLIIKNIFGHNVSRLNLISEAYAQDEAPAEKKNS